MLVVELSVAHGLSLGRVVGLRRRDGLYTLSDERERRDFSLDLAASASLGECPRLSADDLSFAVGPEIDNKSDEVVKGSVGALVDEGGGESREREHDEAELQTAVDRAAGDERHGPFEGHHEHRHDQIDNLQYRYRLDGRIQGLGQKVPKDLGPEEALESGSKLVCQIELATSVMAWA